VADGGVVSAVAYGFPDGVAGEVVIFSTPTLLGAFTIDSSGVFAGQLELPAGIEPGEHTLVLTAGGYTTSLGLVVVAPEEELPTPAPGVLPTTGREPAGAMLMVAVVFMALGVVLLSRRRGAALGRPGLRR
jgi:LPXTG-motif cell wall-anchored protein